MLWLYTKLNTKLNTNFDFYQVFVDSKIVYNQDNNIIYSFEVDKNDPNIIFNKSLDLNKIKCKDICFDIKIKDQIISYTNDKTNEKSVFSSKMNFIEQSDNKYKLPIFFFSYKKVNKNRMPNLTNTNYNLSTKLFFKIYKINDNIQYIIETNPLTNIQKKYWITTELNLLNNYLNI